VLSERIVRPNQNVLETVCVEIELTHKRLLHKAFALGFCTRLLHCTLLDWFALRRFALTRDSSVAWPLESNFWPAESRSLEEEKLIVKKEEKRTVQD